MANLNDGMGRFVIPEALPIRHVVTLLERIKVVEHHELDMIIAMKLRDMMLKSERGEEV